MDVALITSCSFPPSEGLATHIVSLASYLIRQGYGVKVYVRRSGRGATEFLEYRQIPFVLVPSGNIPVVSSIVFARKLGHLVANERINVMHYHSPLVLPAWGGGANNPRVVTTFHSMMKEDTRFIEAVSLHAVLNKLMGALVSPVIERRVISASDQLIAVSEGVRSELVTLYGVDASSVEVIVNGVGAEFYCASNGEPKSQVLFVGRLGYRKGVLELLEAIKQLIARGCTLRFIFAGDGPLSGHVQALVDSPESRGLVEWKGRVPDTDIPDLVEESKFLVMTSTYETGPRVVLEAMAAGTVVIATRVGLLEGMDEDCFVEIRDTQPELIAAAIWQAFNLPNADYLGLRAKALEVAASFRAGSTYAKILECYEV